MVLRRIATHDQLHVGVLDVDPAIGHCAASEGGPQTGDRRTVSNSGLRFEIADPEAAHCLDCEKIQFIRVSTAADPTDRFQTVDGVAVFVFLDERVVAGLLGPASDLVNGLIPGDVVPMIRTRTPHLRSQQAPLVDDLLLERSAFRTQRATINRRIGISLDVDHLRDRIFRFITEGMNDYATAYGTVRTNAARLAGTCDLQSLCLRVNRREAEAEHTNTRTSDQACLDEGSSGDIHETHLQV